MQIAKINDYDPLEKTVDFSKLKKVNKDYNFSNEEKVYMILDSCQSDYNIPRNEFKKYIKKYYEEEK